MFICCYVKYEKKKIRDPLQSVFFKYITEHEKSYIFCAAENHVILLPGFAFRFFVPLGQTELKMPASEPHKTKI